MKPELVAAALVVAVTGATAQQPPQSLRPIKFTWATVPAPESSHYAFRLLFRAGSIDDPPGREGLNALTAAMIASGDTQERTAAELDAELDALGARLEVQLGKEATVIAGEVPGGHRDRFVEILAARLTRPLLTAAALERHRDEQLAALRRPEPVPLDQEPLAVRALDRLLYAGHPYAHPALGTVAGLRAVTLDDVRSHLRRYYTVDRLTVGLGGALDAQIMSAVMKALLPLGEAGEGAEPRPLPAPRPRAGTELRLVDGVGPGTAIAIGFPVEVSAGAPDRAALVLAAAHLGGAGTDAGRLARMLNVERGLTDTVRVLPAAPAADGAAARPLAERLRRQTTFRIQVAPLADAHAHFALRLVLRELRRLEEHGLTAASLERARRALLDEPGRWEPELGARVERELAGRFHGVDDPVAALRTALSEVTLEEVNAALREHLHHDRLGIAVVTADAARLRAALLADAASAIDHDGDVPVLEEDRLIQAYPLWLHPEQVEVVAAEPDAAE